MLVLMPLPEIFRNWVLLADGLLPSRGSLVLDTVFLAMFAISVVLLWSILLAQRGQFELHRRIQIGLSAVLLIAILIFELDVRFLTEWRELAKESQYYQSGLVEMSLFIHLCFAIPTPFIWSWVLIQALRRFSSPAAPGGHSSRHKLWGWIAASMMWATAVSGCTFYWLAFIS
jgi:uncharacterized membrane protein YozB (DUF420 family)